MNIPLTIAVVAITLGIIVFCHELGHFIVAKLSKIKVEEFGMGLPPRLFGIKRGDTTYTINAIPLGAFVKTAGEDNPEVPDGLAGKSPWIRLGVYVAGPAANIILAFILIAVSLMIPMQVITGSESGVQVVQVVDGGPAQLAGIQEDDIIYKIDDRRIETYTDMQESITPDKEISVFVEREGSRDLPAITLTPGPEGTIGIYYTWPKPYITEMHSCSLGQSLLISGKFMISFPGLLKDSLSLAKEDPGSALVGPVGVAQLTGEMLSSGVSALIFLAALISIGIGIFNLIPIPPLDGGGMLVAIIEGIRRGRRLSPRGIRLAYTIGTALIITMGVVITYHDILRLIRGETFFP